MTNPTPQSEQPPAHGQPIAPPTAAYPPQGGMSMHPAPVIMQPALNPGRADNTALPQHAVDYMSVLASASSAIGTTSTIAAYTVSFFDVSLTLLAVVGFLSLRRAVTGYSERALKKHLDGEKFQSKLDAAVADAVKAKLGGIVILPNPGNGAGGAIGPAPPGGTP